MFLGKGDSSQLEDDELNTLSHLRRMVETGHIHALDPNETESAIRALDFYSKWESAVSVVGSLRNIVLMSAGGLLFWWATGGENFVTEFIQRSVTP